MIEKDLNFTPISFDEKIGYVYRLYHGDEIVYVGCSANNVTSRIIAHKINKVFERVEVAEVPLNSMLKIEFYLIIKWKPTYNTNLNPPKGIATVEKIKKPSQVTTDVLHAFLEENKIEPFIRCSRTGRTFYEQAIVEKEWVKVYGSYTPKSITLEEKRRLKRDFAFSREEL